MEGVALQGFLFPFGTVLEVSEIVLAQHDQ